jgi:hypothetical protein
LFFGIFDQSTLLQAKAADLLLQAEFDVERARTLHSQQQPADFAQAESSR